jgi:OPT family oligopeptide transporter
MYEADTAEHHRLMDEPGIPDAFEMRERTRDEYHPGHSDDDEETVKLDDEAEEDSPYPEVRAAVRNYDEDLPCNTVRAWTIGLSLTIIGASMNTLFSLRQPSIAIGPLLAQIIAWPMGHGWAAVMPTRQFRTFGITWSLNPGPFNVKEHAIIAVMASVSFSVAYATDIILAQLVFYKQDFGVTFQLLLAVTTQSLGYGIAGMMRKFLGMLPHWTSPLSILMLFAVYPASMIWPGNLVAVALMNAMYESHEHMDSSVLGGTIPRYKWFGMMTVFAFFYYFIPGFFAQCLSMFAFMTWIFPKSPIVNQLFGGLTGLSFLPITFDWAQITGYIGSPLVPPW